MNSNRDYATENINLKERLEVLEKENKPYLELLTNNAKYQNNNQILQQENQDLWQQIENYNHKFAEVERKKCDLIQENEKLKKALEIIKDNPMCVIDVLRFNNYFTYREMYDGVVELSKGDFDLLKEVLGE
jgi:predicted RNase H-like nuclease (RuvC/YqgF family)